MLHTFVSLLILAQRLIKAQNYSKSGVLIIRGIRNRLSCDIVSSMDWRDLKHCWLLMIWALVNSGN